MTESTVNVINGIRILCIAEIRGRISRLNTLAKDHNASAIIHTGNFGFFDKESSNRLPPKTLRHISVFSSSPETKKLALNNNGDLKDQLPDDGLSELPRFLSGEQTLDIPVYTIYGASEDLTVVEKFCDGTYKVKNLHLINETSSFLIETPQKPNIRLVGLGGALVIHRFFDNGDGLTTTAGTHGLMWSTALQVGQLLDTVSGDFDASEIRIFVCHPCPTRDALLNLVALNIRADFTVSSGLHFMYGSSFNEYSAEPSFEQFIHKLTQAKKQFTELWEAVKPQVTRLVEDNSHQKQLLDTVVQMFEKVPKTSFEKSPFIEYLESAYRSLWHFNLCDVDYGSLVLKCHSGRISAESHSLGFDFSQRSADKPKGHKSNGDRNNKRVTNKPSPSLMDGNEKKKEGFNKEESEPVRPGVWIGSCGDNEEEIKKMFHSDDRQFITEIEIKEKGYPSNGKNPVKDDHSNEDKEGSETPVPTWPQAARKFALVYFVDEEKAQTALHRLDREKTGTHVSLIGRRSRPGRGLSRGPRGSLRPKGRIRTTNTRNE